MARGLHKGTGMDKPRISILARDAIRTRYRIEGSPSSVDPSWRDPSWGGREAVIVWCEFTLYGDDDRLASYGGEVWPMAWPTLFESLSDTPSRTGAVRLTAAGRVAVNAANTSQE